jgi:hypothetical protein
MDYFDPSSGENLANACINVDFAPTRDRTLRGGCLYSYKDCRRSRETYDGEKSSLCPMVAALFGEVQWVATPVKDSLPAAQQLTAPQSAYQGLLVRLSCPATATCAVKELYSRQMLVLEDIVTADNAVRGPFYFKIWGADTTQDRTGCVFLVWRLARLPGVGRWVLRESCRLKGGTTNLAAL